MAEPRKLIRLGNSSFAIALPKDWVEKSGLEKGDDVFIEKNSNGEITVSPEFKKSEEKKIEISLDEKNPEFIKRHLHAAYIKGYNTIAFKGDIKNKKFLKEILNEYLSFQIIDSNERETLAKDFFDMKEAKFENFVRRIDNNLREMFEVAISELGKEKISSKMLEELKEIDKEVNKFYFLCSRIFIKGIDNPSVLNILRINGNQLFNNWWISFHLESLGDGLKYLIKSADKLDLESRNMFRELLIKISKEYIGSMESFYQEDSKKAWSVLEQTQKIRAEIDKLDKINPLFGEIKRAFDLIEKTIYQNTKMVFYMRY